mmetsp:Transcript_2350/g.4372  ORF Transcript_2350/g.4372 Transcript_2350/m.4372 type:complete len:969 (+) Transcript_2350:109-3015(+)
MRFTMRTIAIGTLSFIVTLATPTNSFSVPSTSSTTSYITKNPRTLFIKEVHLSSAAAATTHNPLTSFISHQKQHMDKIINQSNRSTQLSASAENIQSTSTTPTRRVGKFQSGVYDKPIVLIGRSTNGKDELSRLALSCTEDVLRNGFDLDPKEMVTSSKQKKNSPLEAVILDLNNLPPETDEMEVSRKIKEYYYQDFLVIYINIQNQVVGDLEQVLIDNSDYELCIKKQDIEQQDDGENERWGNMEWQLQRLLARAFLPLAIPGSDSPSVNTASLTMGQNTFFLSLSFPKITDAEPYVESMCQDVDAMEFRADLLECRDDRFELLYSLQQLRQMCRSHATRAPMLPFLGEVIDDCLPVVYTVRTAHQAGTYPDDEEGIAKMFDLLQLGLRSGVEVLDVESAWDEDKTCRILNQVEDRHATQILGSHHVVGEKVTDEEAIEFNRKCCLGGRAHGAKVVLSIDDQKDDQQALHAAEASREMAAKAGEPVIPHIGLILGNVGKYSRVINIPFTPVTHESLPFVAAPGQMTASELMATRLIMGLVPPMNYGILGHKISYSVSPAMQGAAFAATRLPHSYALIDMEDVEEFVTSDFWNDPVFGGCSVTIPHKQAIIPHLDELTDAAKAIGAVNTVIVKKFPTITPQTDNNNNNNNSDDEKSNLPNNHGNNSHSFPIPTGKEYDLIDKIASRLVPSVIDEESSQQVKDYIEACDNGKGPMVACLSTAEYLSLFLRKHKEAALLYENTCFRPASDKSPNGVLIMDKNRSKTKAYPPACFNLAQMRMTGKGGTKFSRYEGYQLFDRACRAGHGGSCMMQAKMLASYPGSLGEKIPYDPKRASELLASVCDNGDSLSCFTLATMLLRGDFVNAEADNVSPDEARGLKPIKQRKNEANRKKELQDERIALPRDPQRAEKLLLKGCDQSGHAPSCYNLAVMYTQGDDGIAKNEEKAKKYQQKTEDVVSKFGGFGFGGGM